MSRVNPLGRRLAPIKLAGEGAAEMHAFWNAKTRVLSRRRLKHSMKKLHTRPKWLVKCSLRLSLWKSQPGA